MDGIASYGLLGAFAPNEGLPGRLPVCPDVRGVFEVELFGCVGPWLVE